MIDNLWTWYVIYTDGTVHTEAELESMSRVDKERILLLNVANKQGDRNFTTYFHGDMKPVFFRRKRQLVLMGGGEQPDPVEIATVFGWEKEIHGTVERSLTFLLPDGSVWTSDCDMDDIAAVGQEDQIDGSINTEGAS